MNLDIIAHPSSCPCEHCQALHALAEATGANLGAICYKQIPEESKTRLYEIAKPIVAPEPPGDTTARAVKSERVKQYLKDAAQYIEMLERVVGGHLLMTHCKLCGGPKAEGYVCCQCKKDDTAVKFG